MCGIFGVTGNKKNAATIVLNHLKQLEYRGYDSWGIGTSIDGQFQLDKHVGKIGEAQTVLKEAILAIGHTRWATHGGVTNVNSHPHLDCTKKIALVHNGIIENYQEVAENFSKKHQLVSQTDSELFAHLVEENLEKFSFAEAVRTAFLQLKGLSAFVIANADSNELIAIKNGSPIVIGLGEGANYVASDANSLADLTKQVIYLEDQQMAIISQKEVTLLDAVTGKTILPKISQIDWDTSLATKEEYPYFMLKEISEQPDVLHHLLTHLSEQTIRLAKLISKSQTIYLVGCGSAYYAALASSYLLALNAKVDSIVVTGSEFIYKEPFVDQNALVIFFSQSGETMDIILPLKRLKEKSVKTVAIVNVFGSTLYRLADEKIWLEAGPEICVLTTKAFTAMVATMFLVSEQISSHEQTAASALCDVIEDIRRIISDEYRQKYIQPVVHYLKSHHDIFGIGKGLSFPVILESALKIKEVTYQHMEGFASGELKHGVIALIEPGTPCLVMAPADETQSAILSSAMEVKSRGGYIIGVSEQENTAFDLLLPLTYRGSATCLSQVVIAQLIAYQLALAKKLDPDKPRNLAKSVTVV